MTNPPTRLCPKCDSISTRVAGSGIVEFVMSLFFLLKPFECVRCKHRYFRISN